MSPEKNESLRRQLESMEVAQQGISGAKRQGARQLGTLCILLAVVLGALHGLLHVFNPERNLGAFFVLCAAAVLAILALTFGYQFLRRLLPAGFGRKYLIGLGMSLLLYGLGLGLITAGLGAMVVVLLAIVVAMPLLFVGIWMVRQ